MGFFSDLRRRSEANYGERLFYIQFEVFDGETDTIMSNTMPSRVNVVFHWGKIVITAAIV